MSIHENVTNLTSFFPHLDPAIVRKTLEKYGNNIAVTADALSSLAASHTPSPQQIRLTQISQLDIKLPEYWEQNQKFDYEVFEIDLNSDTAQHICSNFKNSVSHCVISKIWRIQNLRLWRWYYLFRQELAERNQGDSNERLVWHGTDIDNIDDIAQNGFDFRLARDGAIGSGIYFAASAATSLNYVRNGQKMLLCRTALGQTTTGRRSLRRPPEKSPGSLYDSVDGCLGTEAMFCIFDNRQSYPEWVIEYNTDHLYQNYPSHGFTFNFTPAAAPPLTTKSLFNAIVVPQSFTVQQPAQNPYPVPVAVSTPFTVPVAVPTPFTQQPVALPTMPFTSPVVSFTYGFQ